MSKPRTAQKFEVSNIERQIVSALKQDVDSLAKQFEASESTSLDVLANLFADKEFSTIFLGRLSVSEFAEFVENLFVYCVRYAVAELPNCENRMAGLPVADEYPPYVAAGTSANRGYDMIRKKLRAQKRTVRERIFGVYMCYCLYFLQPPNFVMPIRVTVHEMESLHRLAHDVLLVDEHMEALYCLYRLIDGGAFAVTPFEVEFNPLLHRRFDGYDEESETTTELSELELSEDFSLLKQLADDVTLKQLTSIHEAYVRVKESCKLPDVGSSTAGVIDVAGYVQKLLHETMAAFANECRQAAPSRGGGDTSARHRRSRIRQSAYAAIASPMHQSRRQRRGDRNEDENGGEEGDGRKGRASTGAQPPMLPVGNARASPPKRIRKSTSRRVKTEQGVD